MFSTVVRFRTLSVVLLMVAATAMPVCSQEPDLFAPSDLVAASDDTSHSPQILTPGGKPADCAFVVCGHSAPVVVRMRPGSVEAFDQNAAPTERIDPASRSLRFRSGETGGWIEFDEERTGEMSVVAIHDDGYLKAFRSDLSQQASIKLSPWHSLKGAVQLNSGPFIKTGVVIAEWKQPEKDGLEDGFGRNFYPGRPKFPSVTVRIAASIKDGQFHFDRLPQGTVTLMVLPERDITDQRIWYENSQLTWTDSSVLEEADKHLPYTATNFDVVQVKGKVDLSDEGREGVPVVGALNKDSPMLKLFFSEGQAGSYVASAASVVLDDDHSFSAFLKRGRYDGQVLVERAINKEFSVWESCSVPGFKVDLGQDTLDMAEGRSRDLGVVTSDRALGSYTLLDRPRDFFEPDPMSRGPVDDLDPSFPGRDVPQPRDPSSRFDRMVEPARKPVNRQETPVDKAIAELVTGMLSAGDRTTRESLKQPLKMLLDQKFDAEQQAREKIVAELEHRLKAAKIKLKSRSDSKDEIVRQQLNGMMSISDDNLLSQTDSADLDSPRGPSSIDEKEWFASSARAELQGFQPFDFDFEMTGTDGRKHGLSQYPERARLVFLWQESDQKCREQVPDLNRLQREYSKYGFQVIGLTQEDTLPKRIGQENVAEPEQELFLNFPSGMVEPSILEQIPDVAEYPTIVFIDEVGKTRLMLSGDQEYGFLDSVVQELLKESAKRHRAR